MTGSVQSVSDIGSPPTSLISSDKLDDFREWARDGGYGEEYFNRWDSRSLWLEELFLSEQADQ